MEMTKKKTKRPKSSKEPTFFLEKLFKELKGKTKDDLLHWNEDGKIIIITDPYKFSDKILHKICKHNNYTSFIRQLNIYGFHKINNIKNSKAEQFINEKFTSKISEDEIKKIPRNNKNDIDDDELNENEIKDEINLLDKIDKQDDDKKYLEYKKLIQNGKLDNKSNIKILEFLFYKNKEIDEYSKKAYNDINEVKNKIAINLQNIQSLNQKYNFDINNNKYFEDKNKINDEKKTKGNYIVPTESFGFFNTRLMNEFKDIDEKKIENTNRNANASFVEGLSMNFDYQKNNNNNYNNPSQTQQRSSFLNLNRTLYIDPNYMNYNDNTILKNMNNSFN